MIAIGSRIAIVLSAFACAAGAQEEHGTQAELLNSSAMGIGGDEHEAIQIFDNFYYVGIDFVSAYVVPTSEGLILIGATYDNMVEHLVSGMRRFGFKGFYGWLDALRDEARQKLERERARGRR